MNRRVEVIPAPAMEFITLSYVGASTYQFMFPFENDEKAQERNLEALNSFVDKYAPADQTSVTDYFSSKEIQSIIAKHTGRNIDLLELNEMLQNMQYEYLLQDDEFKWMVKKV